MGNQCCHCRCSNLCPTTIWQNPLPHLSTYQGGLGTRTTDWPSWKDSQRAWCSQGSIWWIDQEPSWWGRRPLQICLSRREACDISLVSLHMRDGFVTLSYRQALSACNRDDIKVCDIFYSLNGVMNLSRYFWEMLLFFSSPPFYSDHIHLLTADTPLSSKIQDNPLFFPFLWDAIGVINKIHINANITLKERQASCNRKGGGVTQNCLAAWDFDMRFTYIFSGWDASTMDATMFHDARLMDLPVPHGKYYLADAGFQTCDALLILYHGVCYHLAKWGHVDLW